jgi:hypothetical protein
MLWRTAMPKSDLIDLIRHHDAISAITPSASRKMVSKGDIQKVRNFLDHLDIKSFGNSQTFERVLDRATKKLAKHLPKGKWGAARKFLNLYLRPITYNFYLRRAYRLERIEALLELPMDSFAIKGLRHDHRGSRLPRWKGVIHLTPEVNAVYQAAAEQIAKDKGLCRVHLDMAYWRAKPKRKRRGY